MTTKDPVATFAPLVLLHPRESSFPMSARYFLSKSGLEWAGGPCRFERDVSASASSSNAAADPLPPMNVQRLGRPPGYQVRASSPDCTRLRPERYSSTMHTRPFDWEDRPVGLYRSEGFNLDILTDAQPGRLRTDSSGKLTGVPVYYAVDRATVAGRPGLRLSYWMLYGRGRRPDPDDGNRVVEHEGDWERLDVLVQRRSNGRSFVPIAVRYHSDAGTRTLSWEDVERASGQPAHPVAVADLRSHTPRPGSDCSGCISWQTWDDLLDVRDQPWFGYGGGWGAIGTTDASSGPLGPSPFDVGPSPG